MRALADAASHSSIMRRCVSVRAPACFRGLAVPPLSGAFASKRCPILPNRPSERPRTTLKRQLHTYLLPTRCFPPSPLRPNALPCWQPRCRFLAMSSRKCARCRPAAFHRLHRPGDLPAFPLAVSVCALRGRLLPPSTFSRCRHPLIVQTDTPSRAPCSFARCVAGRISRICTGWGMHILEILPEECAYPQNPANRCAYPRNPARAFRGCWVSVATARPRSAYAAMGRLLAWRTSGLVVRDRGYRARLLSKGDGDSRRRPPAAGHFPPSTNHC